jgi:hypothetical protein
VHLGHVLPGQRAARLAREVEAQAGQFGVDRALAAVFGGQVGQFLGVAALGDPGRRAMPAGPCGCRWLAVGSV